MSKTITYKQGDVTYEVKGMLGAWCTSRERKYVPKGTTRMIGGKLMYVYSIYNEHVSLEKFLLFKILCFFTLGLSLFFTNLYETEHNWCSVDKNDGYEEIRKWVDSLN